MKKGSLSSKRFCNYGQVGVVMRKHGQAVGHKQVDQEIAKNTARHVQRSETGTFYYIFFMLLT
jgi:hypothetical protein